MLCELHTARSLRDGSTKFEFSFIKISDQASGHLCWWCSVPMYLLPPRGRKKRVQETPFPKMDIHSKKDEQVNNTRIVVEHHLMVWQHRRFGCTNSFWKWNISLCIFWELVHSRFLWQNHPGNTSLNILVIMFQKRVESIFKWRRKNAVLRLVKVDPSPLDKAHKPGLYIQMWSRILIPGIWDPFNANTNVHRNIVWYVSVPWIIMVILWTKL